MVGLYEAPLGADAIVRPTRLGLLRRVLHGTTSFMLDTDNEVGLVLNLSGSHRIERRMHGRTRCDVPRTGSVSVLPPGCPATFTITGACRVVQLRLPWLEPIELQPSLNGNDPTLSRLLVAAAVAQTEDVAAYLSNIVLHLQARYAASRPTSRPAPAAGGIPPARLWRVLRRIDEELSLTGPLTALAAEAGMNLAHFSRAFTQETGLPPHQYIVRRRVERAVELLPQLHLSVDEVACRAGFAHASHLARHMRRVIGTTPAAFRTHVLP